MADSKDVQSKQIPAHYQRLTGSERHPAPQAKLLSHADPNERFSVTIVLRRRTDGHPMPSFDAFAKIPPSQRRRLSMEEFAARHGAHPSELEAVTRFASEAGLTITEANVARRSVIVSGTGAQMEKAFSVTLNRYEVSSLRTRRALKTSDAAVAPQIQNYRGRDGFIHVPKEIAHTVVGVFGLDNRKIGQHNSTGDPSNTKALSIPQIAKLYDFPTNSAAGQTIAIFSFGGPGQFPGDPGSGFDTTAGPTNDITQYFASIPGFTAPDIITVPATSISENFGPDLETEQDICVASTVAQGATIAVYFLAFFGSGQNGWHDLIERVVTPDAGDFPAGVNPPSVLSSSDYICDGDDAITLANEGITSSFIDAVHMAFEDAALQGITVCIASGDQGADSKVGSSTGVSEWGEPFSAEGGAHVQYPGSDPLVLACGGTTIGGVSGPSFTEYVWNDVDSNFGITNGATGGGVSDYFTQAKGNALTYQQAAGLTPTSVNDKHVGRGVPDVAGNASGNSGWPISVGGFGQVINGTSAVAPLYAGLIATLNAALGENIGFLNPTLYALGTSVCRAVTGPPGPTNNSLNGITGYSADAAWNPCTGWGVIDGNALLAALQTLSQKTLTFVMQRSTFGEDDVKAATGGAFPQAFFVTVDGLKPTDFPYGGVTTLSPSSVQLTHWAPVIPNPGGTTIRITPTAVSSDDPDLSPEIQRFTFTYTITFPDLTPFTTPPASAFPEILTLNASLAANTGALSASQPIELILAADPFFSSESNGGSYWLSEDIRVFYAEQGSTLFGAPALGTTPADAQNFIQWIIGNISGPLGTGTNGDTFESLPTAEGSALLSLLPNATNSPHNAIFNFAIARVRLNGESEQAKKVRAFFRLFQSQSVNVPYQAAVSSSGVSAPTGAYRQYSDGTVDGFKTPLLGISSDGTEYITVPCFASARQPNTTVANNMTTQEDSPNVKTITPVPGETVYTYFGCWLDNNQMAQVFPFAPGANPDGPFSGTLNSVSQVIDRGGHQCIVVEVVDDDAPIINNATPGTSDKIAQRNLAFTTVANPGLTDSRLATHTFEIRRSPFTLTTDEMPDELMIDWGNVPVGSVASIYLPAVQSADVLSLAARMYTVHNLIATDANTLECKTGGITYIPIPQGSGPHYAGLFSVQLPLGIKHGQEFRIVVRQITSSFEDLKGVAPNNPVIDAESSRAVRLSRRRFVYGAFQINIPVSVKTEMLIPEERNLSFFKWIQEAIPTTSRWYPVFQRFVAQLVGKVTALGGDGSSVPPTQTGIWPGLPGFGTGSGKGPHHGLEPCPGTGEHACYAVTGKVDGIIYDHFGDFEAFLLETFEGNCLRFVSHELAVLKLVQRAWSHRILVTVRVHKDRKERPLEIVLHGAPPQIGE